MTERELQTLPNIGPAVATMLLRLGVERPDDLRDRNADQLYRELCDIDGKRHDPCLLDTLTAAVDFVNGAPARPWWHYSRIRKAQAS